MCVRSNGFILLFKTSVIEKKVFKSSTIILELSVSSLSSVNFCLYTLGSVGAYIFVILSSLSDILSL